MGQFHKSQVEKWKFQSFPDGVASLAGPQANRPPSLWLARQGRHIPFPQLQLDVELEENSRP